MSKKSLQKKSRASHNKDLVPGNNQSLEPKQGLTPFEMALEDPAVKKEVLKAFYTQALPVSIEGLGAGLDVKAEGKNFYAIMKTVRDALMDESLQTDTINKILAEVIAGAYQDRVVAYTHICKDNNLEVIRTIQQRRQSADNHLLHVIQAFKNFKRPPVNVVVRRTEQVNVADKQINVSQTKSSPSDLDRKNENTS